MEQKLKDHVEVFEIKTFEIKAKNKPDAEVAIKKAISSQDELIELKSERNFYKATVKIFVLRDW